MRWGLGAGSAPAAAVGRGAVAAAPVAPSRAPARAIVTTSSTPSPLITANADTTARVKCEVVREGYTAEQAASFGSVAAEYERVRPEYPAAAVGWIVPPGARAAVDVGAGTGKLTRALAGRGLEVTAVEPSDEMRARLEAELPTVTALAGSGERLPLADGSADLVTYAQAWHWVDEAAALAEAARVLRPGGRLACVWNLRDDGTAWMRELSRLIDRLGANPTVEDDYSFGAPFGPTERLAVPWRRPIDGELLIELLASRSYVIVATEAQRQELFASVRELVATHPELAGRESFEMPYMTRCFRAELPPG
ncbi:MAG: class I SAM-dependent methyltransferase [Actinobacteria bacterium]|nr:class I SAM-dependent methyltransferase [Actinomycetota bacterium]